MTINRKKVTYIINNHTNMACASLFISFTGLMVKLSQSRHNIGKVIQTEKMNRKTEKMNRTRSKNSQLSSTTKST